MRKKVCGGSQAGPPVLYQVRPRLESSSPKKAELLHVCPKCSASFVYSRHLKKHLESHGRNDCQSCSALFTCRKKLVLHMREKHGKKLLDSKFACTLCEKSFTRRNTLHAHLRCHAVEGQLVCEVCGTFLNSEAEMEEHMKQHEEFRLSCPLCHQTFARRQQYSRHMQSHWKYRCVTCERGFSSWRAVLSHERQGHEVRRPPPRHTCALCSKELHTKAALQTHLETHAPSSSLACQVCCKQFCSAKSLALHATTERHLVMVQAASREVGFVCESCGRHFLRQTSLEKHRLRSHLERRIFCCAFCPHVTNFKANLTRHVRLHLDERQFVCEQCGAAFHVLSALKDHRLYLHSNEREHVCSICQKAFKRASELHRHYKTHSDERPYACDCCDKSFKRSSHLKRHREKFHDEVIVSRQVQRLKQDDNGIFRPVPKESKPSRRKSNNQLLMLSYDDHFCEDNLPSSEVVFLTSTEPHLDALSNVLGADVKLSDSMAQNGRDSPLCMADLVRLQDFRERDSPLCAELGADPLASLTDSQGAQWT